MANYDDVKSSGLFFGPSSKWYSPTDEDCSGATEYYGLVAADGTWVIIEKAEPSTDISTYRYAAGHVDLYTTNWTGRASLTYKYYNELF